MGLPSSCFSSVANYDIRHENLASITLVKPFLNTSIHSYTFQPGNVLSPYQAQKSMRFSAPLTPSDHRILRHLSALLQCKLKDTHTHTHVQYSTPSHILMEGTCYNQGQTTRIQCTKLPSLSSLPINITLQTTECRNSLKYPCIIRKASNSEPKYRVIITTRQGWIKAHRPPPSAQGISW